MALICLGSVGGAPGVTTLSVVAAGCWPRPVVLLEADPSGGVLAVRHRLGRTPGLSGLAAVVRQGAPPNAVWTYSQVLSGDLPVVVAPESGPVATAILEDAAHSLADWCASQEEVDIIVDCGRVAVRDVTWPLWAVADEMLLVTRPRADELYPVAHRMKALGSHVRSLGVVLVGERPYRPDEVETQLGLPIRGVVADDARAARVLATGGSGRTLRRSSLVRSTRSLVDTLCMRFGIPVAADEPVLPSGGAEGADRRRPRRRRALPAGAPGVSGDRGRAPGDRAPAAPGDRGPSATGAAAGDGGVAGSARRAGGADRAGPAERPARPPSDPGARAGAVLPPPPPPPEATAPAGTGPGVAAETGSPPEADGPPETGDQLPGADTGAVPEAPVPPPVVSPPPEVPPTPPPPPAPPPPPPAASGVRTPEDGSIPMPPPPPPPPVGTDTGTVPVPDVGDPAGAAGRGAPPPPPPPPAPPSSRRAGGGPLDAAIQAADALEDRAATARTGDTAAPGAGDGHDDGEPAGAVPGDVEEDEALGLSALERTAEVLADGARPMETAGAAPAPARPPLPHRRGGEAAPAASPDGAEGPGDREPGDREPGDREPGDREPGDRGVDDRDDEAGGDATAPGLMGHNGERSEPEVAHSANPGPDESTHLEPTPTASAAAVGGEVSGRHPARPDPGAASTGEPAGSEDEEVATGPASGQHGDDEAVGTGRVSR